MALKTTITDDVFEESTSFLSGTFINPLTGLGFKPSTLVGTLYNVEDESVINSRNATNYFDLNGATIDSDGVLSLELTPDDNQIVGTRTGKTREKHRMLLVWTWASGTRTGRHEFEWHVEENPKVS